MLISTGKHLPIRIRYIFIFFSLKVIWVYIEKFKDVNLTPLLLTYIYPAKPFFLHAELKKVNQELRD